MSNENNFYKRTVDDTERLRFENEILRENIEELQARGILDENCNLKVRRHPLIPGTLASIVVGIVFMIAGNDIIPILTKSFGESLMLWLGIFFISTLIFTFAYVIFDTIILEKLDKISQSGAYFSPNRSAIKGWIPTIVLIATIVILALLCTL